MRIYIGIYKYKIRIYIVGPQPYYHVKLPKYPYEPPSKGALPPCHSHQLTVKLAMQVGTWCIVLQPPQNSALLDL